MQKCCVKIIRYAPKLTVNIANGLDITTEVGRYSIDSIELPGAQMECFTLNNRTWSESNESEFVSIEISACGCDILIGAIHQQLHQNSSDIFNSCFSSAFFHFHCTSVYYWAKHVVISIHYAIERGCNGLLQYQLNKYHWCEFNRSKRICTCLS